MVRGSKFIRTALDDDFIRRMRNWADAARGVTIKAITLDLGYSPGYRDNPPVVLFGEARDTQDALARLPSRLGQAVAQYWTFEDEPIRWHSRRRHVHHNTFTAWVVQGHELLKGEIYRARDQRAAVVSMSPWFSRN